MSEKYSCDECGDEVEASNEQAAFLVESRSKGMDFIVLDCLACGAAVFWNPQEGAPHESNEPSWPPCPEEKCDGFVNYVEEDADSFWGCGHCGQVWEPKPEWATLLETHEKEPPNQQ